MKNPDEGATQVPQQDADSCLADPQRPRAHKWEWKWVGSVMTDTVICARCGEEKENKA